MDTEVVIIVISLLLSAFFSGMEIAYISSNKIHIEIEKKQNGFLAKILTKLTAKPSKFIATMLIGNNIALVIYGFFMGELLVNWFQSLLPTNYGVINYLFSNLSLLTQTVISTFIILITAEFLPKVFFQIYSNLLLKVFAIPAFVFYYLFSIISDFVLWISDVVLKQFFKTEGDQVQLVFSKVELGNYISEQMEAVEENDEVDSEIQIFQNALEFSFRSNGKLNKELQGYSYKMEGIDEDWSEINKKNTKEYTNIRHGDYIFLLRSINKNGQIKYFTYWFHWFG